MARRPPGPRVGAASLHVFCVLGANRPIRADDPAHRVVDHSKGEYVTAKSHGTNKAANSSSQLKRSLAGTRHDATREHLPKHPVEFDLRTPPMT
jgi:hypothetical protein